MALCWPGALPNEQDLRHPPRVNPSPPPCSPSLMLGRPRSYSGEVAPRAAVPRVPAGSLVTQGTQDDDNELGMALRDNPGHYHKGWP